MIVREVSGQGIVEENNLSLLRVWVSKRIKKQEEERCIQEVKIVGGRFGQWCPPMVRFPRPAWFSQYPVSLLKRPAIPD